VTDNVRLHVWLIQDHGEGVSFLADVERMLNAYAKRRGALLVSAGTPSNSGSDDLTFSVTGDPSALSSEVGVHRAQRVPHNSVGRVETSLVGVEILTAGDAPATSRPEAPVLKTYNYVYEQVVRHSTGEKHTLAEVLAGEA
jgi:protein subunit release factor A